MSFEENRGCKCIYMVGVLVVLILGTLHHEGCSCDQVILFYLNVRCGSKVIGILFWSEQELKLNRIL